MNKFIVRDLDAEEVQQVSGGNLLYVGVAAGVAVVGAWGGTKLVEWFDSPPGRGSAEISDAILREIRNPYIDDGNSCRPIPGEESDVGG